MLWWLVVVRLLIPEAPSSTLSLYNLGELSRTHFEPKRPPLTEASAPVVLPLVAGSVDRAGEASAAAVTVRQHLDWRGWLAWLWVVGAAGYLFWVGLQQVMLGRRLARLSRVDPALESLVDEERVRMGIGRRVRSCVTPLVCAPALFGWWRPRLLMPEGYQWSEEELRWVVLHELAHVKGHDVLVNWLLVLVQAVHWFNPFLWWSLRRLRGEREMLCDARAMQGASAAERREYGALLLRLGAQGSTLVSILNHKNQLKRRIAMIARPETPRYAWVLASGLCLGLTCLTFTRAAEPAPSSPPATERQEPAGERDVATLRELKDQLAKLDAVIAKKEEYLDELR
jgi:bla regulator protein BlaR1